MLFFAGEEMVDSQKLNEINIENKLKKLFSFELFIYFFIVHL